MTITKHETCHICGAQIKIEMDDQAGNKFTALADKQIKRFLKIHERCKHEQRNTRPTGENPRRKGAAGSVASL
jgi:hypothetical protein